MGTLNGDVKRISTIWENVDGNDVSMPLIVLSEHEKYSYLWAEDYHTGKIPPLPGRVVAFIMFIPLCGLTRGDIGFDCEKQLWNMVTGGF